MPFRRAELCTPWRRAPQNALLRLKSAEEFERVRRDGRSHAHPLVVLIARRRQAGEVQRPGHNRLAGPQADERPRFGFLAGKGAGSAVARNRAKRLLREAARSCAAAVAPNWDLVLIARKPLAGATAPEVVQALAGLMRRAKVAKDLPPNGNS